MLNSAEHEICPADKYKYKIITISNSLLLNIAEHENFSANKYEKANYCLDFQYLLAEKIYAQLSWAWKMFYK